MPANFKFYNKDTSIVEYVTQIQKYQKNDKTHTKSITLSILSSLSTRRCPGKFNITFDISENDVLVAFQLVKDFTRFKIQLDHYYNSALINFLHHF